VDNGNFSPQAQQVICAYEEEIAKLRVASETDLEYLRRTRPDMPEEARVAYMLWSIVAGKHIKES